MVHIPGDSSNVTFSSPIVGGHLSMVVEMVPLKGGIGGIVHPPIGRFFTTYIPQPGG